MKSIIKHPRIALISILLAVMLSLLVRSESNFTSVKFYVDVNLENLPDSQMVVWQSARQIEAEVRGPGFLVSRLTLNPPKLSLHPSVSKNSNRLKIDITQDSLGIAEPLSLIGVSPSYVEFSLDEKVVKEFPVKVPKLVNYYKDKSSAEKHSEVVSKQNEIGDKIDSSRDAIITKIDKKSEAIERDMADDKKQGNQEKMQPEKSKKESLAIKNQIINNAPNKGIQINENN